MKRRWSYAQRQRCRSLERQEGEQKGRGGAWGGQAEEQVLKARVLHLPLAFDDKWTQGAINKYMKSVRGEAPYLPSNIDFIAANNGLEGGRSAVRDTVFSASYMVLGLGDVYLGAPCAVPLDPRCGPGPTCFHCLICVCVWGGGVRVRKAGAHPLLFAPGPMMYCCTVLRTFLRPRPPLGLAMDVGFPSHPSRKNPCHELVSLHVVYQISRPLPGLSLSLFRAPLESLA